MNKSIPFFIKLLSILLLVVGIMFPLLIGSVSIAWLTDAPPGASADFEGTIFELGALTVTASELIYDEANNEFTMNPVGGDNEFINAITAMQSVAMILIIFAIAMFLIGALIHLKKPSKFASFLILLGILAAAAVVGLVIFLQSIALDAIAAGGTRFGDSVYKDNIFVIDTISYTWRFTAVLQLGMGLYALGTAAVLSFMSLFMKGDYDEY